MQSERADDAGRGGMLTEKGRDGRDGVTVVTVVTDVTDVTW